MNTILPFEILIKVLLNLDSAELTRASCTCRFWRDIIESDLCLRRSCFRYPSLSYYDEGCEPTLEGGPSDLKPTCIRFHPAMQRISYRMGDSISAARIGGHDVNGGYMSLADLPIQNDFVTIPSITNLDVEILPEENNTVRKKSGLRGITFSVSNPSGIKLKDIFTSLVKETSELCDLVAYASGGTCNQRIRSGLTYFKKAEILGKQKSYAGVKNTIVEGGKVSVIFRTVM